MEIQGDWSALERALDVVGDRWTLVVLHELSLGVVRFNDIQRHTQMPRDGLARRLRRLERRAVIARSLYCSNPPRYEYYLTRSGEALKPALAELQNWGTHSRPSDRVYVDLVDKRTSLRRLPGVGETASHVVLTCPRTVHGGSVRATERSTVQRR